MELHLIGEILGANGFPSGSLMCKWQIVYGDAWTVLEGAPEGQTQVDDPDDGENAVWCHPLDIHMRSTSLGGWPRIRVQVWHHDGYGRNEIYGYGMCHVPTMPGEHAVECETWRPKGSILEEVTAFFLGGAPRLLNEGIVTSAEERQSLRTVSAGTVQLRMAVILKDHERHGFHVR